MKKIEHVLLNRLNSYQKDLTSIAFRFQDIDIIKHIKTSGPDCGSDLTCGLGRSGFCRSCQLGFVSLASRYSISLCEIYICSFQSHAFWKDVLGWVSFCLGIFEV